ncbi:MAG: hypothetical protein CMO01_04285 [Thalassobius sp.]|nr:hypothetical protein [Thalassovita sp.]
MRNPIFLLFLFLTFIISSCNKDDETDTTGYAEGNVLELSTTIGLAEVLITVFDADTNEPIETLETDADGNFTLELNEGSYYLRLNKQGYQDIPPLSMSPLPFEITVGATESLEYEMLAIEGSNNGWISGTVKEGGNAIAGALVTVVSGETAFSAYSNESGEFSIFNVEAGSYQADAWIKGYASTSINVTVTSNTESTDNNISMQSGSAGVFNGTIRNLSTSNKDVDIALVHPITMQAIPGLNTFSSGQSFEISNVPSGTFIARATFENDSRVMDPDRIAKFGETEVTFNDDVVELTFDITNTVEVNTITNTSDDLTPVEINTTTPTFEWTAYSSTSDYVIEVSDMNGNVVWGGFGATADELPTKNVIIPSSQLSVKYNSDGSASLAALEAGKTYRWRVFASKDDKNSDTGWTLISASEDQRGIFKVVE